MTIYPNILLKTLSSFDFEVAEDSLVQQFDIVVKKGSITNLTSPPRWLWWLIPPHGDSKFASIVHDYLIRSGYNQIYADTVFLFLLRTSVATWQAHIMYFGITLFPRLRAKYQVK
jgi:hypothetical protein